MKRQIKSVEHATPCPSDGKPRVRITFEGQPILTITVHDDGSFVEWLGETEQ